MELVVAKGIIEITAFGTLFLDAVLHKIEPSPGKTANVTD
jgi:hypothetical protein